MSEAFQIYRHSGKFGLHGPILALVAAAALAFPLGFAYAYLVKWIPFIYLNFLLTAGYGFVFGVVSAWVLRLAKTRNTGVAVLCGLLAGLFALYFEWSAHIHAVFKGAPVLCTPLQLWGGVQQLYEDGSWSLRGGGNVTGIPLAIVWGVEALFILGLGMLVPLGMIGDTPFCEQNQCWLDEEKKIDTLEAFTEPDHLSAFRQGDLAPLSKAKPRTPDSSTFARVTLKHSPRCDQFCTVSVANITVTRNSNGDPTEKTQELARNLMLPKSMFELIAKFEGFKQETPPA
jgi:hypothetical protein